MDTAKRRRLNCVDVDWNSLPEELLLSILSYLDVRTWVERNGVSRDWRELATSVIDA